MLTLNTDLVLHTGPFDRTGEKPSSDDQGQSLVLTRYNQLVSTNDETLISGSGDHMPFFWSLFPSRVATIATSDAAAERGGKLKPVVRLTGHQHGRWAASAAWDSSVRIWDGRTSKFVTMIGGHIGPAYRLTWSADSRLRLLVSASKDSTVKIWDLKTYKLKTYLPGHTDEVYCVDPVADRIVSDGRERTVEIWKH
ncbi:WD40 repeat-like protein [Wolfiporia cocos MD-104 SS10]|uniref:WD40 repeat-like protein n=1 Tax=Wolfiporia cocos (strain MD-104) TaxID=742152 RepID=A0A2H3J2P4_WOLCO|nr:WD40 repeat-like protein [Wolfiporia cocos MD-104 SS10]